MQIIQAKPRGFYANTYILTADGKNAVVIDPGHSGVAAELKTLGLRCAYVVLTHCHFDHVDGTPSLQQAGAKVLCSAKEASLIGTNADLYGLFGAPRNAYTADKTFQGGDVLSLCGVTLTVLETPGHTAGSACLLLQDGEKNCLFTGDTLFAGSVGRTDFPTGDGTALRRSLKKLYDLTGEYVVYPGHDKATSLSAERKTNPFMREI